MWSRFPALSLFVLLLSVACGSDPAPKSSEGGQCSDDGDCVSGLYCVLGTCTEVLALDCTVNSDCPTAWCKNGHCAPPVPCTTSAQCPLDAVCDPWGICVPDEGSKCALDSHCDDGNPCTDDDCDGGECQNTAISGCCTKPSDCDDDDTTTADDCQDNQCVNQPIGEACEGNSDCDDQNFCTLDRCASKVCSNEPIKDCCYGVADCDDQDEGTIDSCVNNKCVHEEKPDTCTGNDQCVDNDNCTVDLCDNGVCAHVESAYPFCCNVQEDCNDGNPMTVDSCVTGSCKNQPLSCQGDGQCNDANACTTDKCLNQECVNTVLINDACRCAANSDCVGKGGVCALVADGDNFGAWCMSPKGALQGAAECSNDEQCRSNYCMDFQEGDDICFQACRENSDCASNALCDTINFLFGGETIPMKICLPGADLCGGDKDCPDGDICFPIGDPTTPGHIIGICDKKDVALKGAGKVCTKDSECQSGLCTEPIGKTAKICWSICANDDDCAAGLFCYPNILYFTFDGGTPADPTDDTLFAPGSCFPYSGTYTTCVGDGDCPANEFCYWGKNETFTALEPRCLLPMGTGTSTGGQECVTDSQCKSDVCMSAGFCLGLCKGNSDCSNGTTCKSMALFLIDDNGTADPDDDEMASWPFCQP